MADVAALVDRARKLGDAERVELLGSLLAGGGMLFLAGTLSSLETKLGVKAAVTAGPAVAGGGAKKEAEAPAAFDVVLKGAGAKKIDVIKVIRAETGLGLKEAKDMADAGGPVKKGLAKDEADKLTKALKDAGADVEQKPAQA